MNLIAKGIKFIKKNKAAILAVGSIAGLAYTAIKVGVEAPKAVKEIEEIEEERGEELTTFEKVKVATPYFIKPAVVGGLTAISMGASAYFSTKSVNGLIALASALGSNKIPAMPIDGERVSLDVNDKKQRFFDPLTGEYFESTTADILNAFYKMNKKLMLMNHITIDDYCKTLHLPKVPWGDYSGWEFDDLLGVEGGPWLDYYFEEATDYDTGEQITVLKTKADMECPINI